MTLFKKVSSKSKIRSLIVFLLLFHVRLGCSTSFAERWFALLSIGIGLEKQSTPMISASPRCRAPADGTRIFKDDAQGAVQVALRIFRNKEKHIKLRRPARHLS